MNYLEKYKAMPRNELLAETVRSKIKCCPAALSEVEDYDVVSLGFDIYALMFKGTAYGLTVFDDYLASHLEDVDFKIIERIGSDGDSVVEHPERGMPIWHKARDEVCEGKWIIRDVRSEYSYEELLQKRVMVCTRNQTFYPTLAEAIKTFGQTDSELYDPEDYRRFARCPPLKGLCGPMFPNTGYIARYETAEVYDMLSR